jgi:hypothetical protein
VNSTSPPIDDMSRSFHDRAAPPVRGTGEQCDGGELYVPAE